MAIGAMQWCMQEQDSSVCISSKTWNLTWNKTMAMQWNILSLLTSELPSFEECSVSLHQHVFKMYGCCVNDGVHYCPRDTKFLGIQKVIQDLWNKIIACKACNFSSGCDKWYWDWVRMPLYSRLCWRLLLQSWTLLLDFWVWKPWRRFRE